eukprot:g7934.t1
MQAAEPPANKLHKYDALADEINSRKAAVMNARSVPADHLGQYSNGDVTGLAASKLDGYRRNTGAMRTYNEATGRLLSPPRQDPQQHTSRLRVPQHGRSAAVAPIEGAEIGSNGFPVALAANGSDAYPDANGARGDVVLGGSAAGADASRDDTIAKLNKIVRQKNATIQEKDKELKRYKGQLDKVTRDVGVIEDDIITTDQRIQELADDLAVEKHNHEAARQSLEAKTGEAEAVRQRLEEQSASLQQKTREVEQHSLTLAKMERASAAAHEHNLSLTRQIEELTRLADERQGAKGDGEPREELEKLQQAVDMKTRQLEAVKERADRTSMELQYFKGQARSGRFKSWVLTLWSLLRAVGFLGFLLFVYVAVSEDAFRPRGVDVRRLAH